MKIVVDELPEYCSFCMFEEWESLRNYCKLTKFFTDSCSDREEHCPLIELSRAIKEVT